MDKITRADERRKEEKESLWFRGQTGKESRKSWTRGA